MQVQKRDGSLEDFDQGKIARVVHAAGLTEDQAQTLAETLNQWANAIGKPLISTREIRDKVIEELYKVNRNAANLFVWYQGTKEQNPAA